MPHSSSDRFLGRVGNYARYRPSYPAAAIDLLEQCCGLRPGAAAVDLGSGTGILSALLLARGATVFGIEPNSEMRDYSGRALRGEFHVEPGTAEDTHMPDGFFDLLVAGQSFHWFDPQKARAEALRILKPGAWAALLWNERPKDQVPFLEDYEALLRRYAAEYGAVARLRAHDDGIHQFFGQPPRFATFPNEQLLDFEGLQGRVMSASYAPLPEQPEHRPLMAGLREVFDHHQRNGKVVFPYRTKVYFGQPGASA